MVWKRWKEKTVEEKTDWCLKWFKILIVVMVAQGALKIIESIMTLKLIGML